MNADGSSLGVYRDAALFLRVEFQPTHSGRHADHLTTQGQTDWTRVTWAGGWVGDDRLDMSLHRDGHDSGTTYTSRYRVEKNARILPPGLGIEIAPRKRGMFDRMPGSPKPATASRIRSKRWMWLEETPTRGEVSLMAQFLWSDRTVPSQYGTPRKWVGPATLSMARRLLEQQSSSWVTRADVSYGLWIGEKEVRLKTPAAESASEVEAAAKGLIAFGATLKELS